MKIRRNDKLLVEPPSSATGDIAFNLIVFFLVCASVQPDSGVKQSIPASEEVEEEKQESQNIEVMLTRQAVSINGDFLPMPRFAASLRSKLQGKTDPEDRIVVVKSRQDVPYHHWIAVTTAIQEAGGIITLQLEEEREVQLPQ